MIKVTHIYKTEKAGVRDNQSELHIDKRDPKFFFTLQAEKPATFTAGLLIKGAKPECHIFDVHERQANRGIDYAFKLPKLPEGEYEAVFIIYVKGVVIEQKQLRLIV